MTERQSEQVKCRVSPAPENVCGIEAPGPFCVVIFGATGDLTRRKLIPALYRLMVNGHLPGDFLVFGTAIDDMDDASFRALMKEAVRDAYPDLFTEDKWDGLAARLYYSSGRFDDPGFYRGLKDKLPPLEKKHGTGGNRLFYLAIPPPVYETVTENLGLAGLSEDSAGRYSRISVEKPFGRDLRSSSSLNAALRKWFREDQIYRMDHYLAKETVQNILMFRFANSIFEPLWNRRYIDHVQITVSETLGVEHRAGYYEKSGVIRDMFQSHILQLLSLVAMEPPSAFEADRVRDEKVKVFRSIRPFPLDSIEQNMVLGQYGKGNAAGAPVPAYRDEPGVAHGSSVPTYAAIKLHIDNWRWSGVPFYLRSGKRLPSRMAEIAVRYRQVPHLMFSNVLEGRIEPNTLVLRVQPDEGIGLSFQTKTPDSKVCLSPVLMDFSYRKVFMLDAYERVLLDCMAGDQMLFVREDSESATWELLTPVLERIEAEARPEGFPNYAAGSSGPAGADALIQKDGREWRPL